MHRFVKKQLRELLTFFFLSERNDLEFIEMSAKTNTNVDKAFEDLLTGNLCLT
jgi:hypothetical protein